MKHYLESSAFIQETTSKMLSSILWSWHFAVMNIWFIFQSPIHPRNERTLRTPTIPFVKDCILPSISRTLPPPVKK